MLWDDNQSKCIGELKFKSEVKGVQMNKETIAVVLEDRIYVYEFSNLKIRDAIETYINPDGICCLSSKKDTNILACPDKTQGAIRVTYYDNSSKIQAHEGPIACLAMTTDGQTIASASSKGTLVRIFNATSGSKLQEVRRGADSAKVYSISFSTNDMMAVTSDKGTVHVYSVETDDDERKKTEENSTNTKSMFGFMKGLIEYAGSEWSFATFKFNEDTKPMYTA
jgi:WD40 repeat protein